MTCTGGMPFCFAFVLIDFHSTYILLLSTRKVKHVLCSLSSQQKKKHLNGLIL